MKSHVIKVKKSAPSRKRKKRPSSKTTASRGKITEAFAEQVAAFIERYRPALEALAKR